MSAILYPSNPVLIVDDEIGSLLMLDELLKESGITHTITCSDSREVEKIIRGQPVSLILLDLCMPFISGEDLIPLIKQKLPEVPIIVITASDDAEVAVRCMKKGVYDYFLKNTSIHNPDERIRPILHKALELSELKQVRKQLEKKILTPRIEQPLFFDHIITRHFSMLSIFEYIEAISQSTETVLITGETGTGKELIAKAIHRASGRKGELVAVNVAALDDTQFSDALYGHGPGAFTDAKTARKGLVELAQGGTLFIDEIADVNMDAQQKLLRLLEEREYRPLGIDHPRISNAKVIAATNKDIQKLINEGRFRHDLYYRLNTHAIHLPPLRERKEDIPLLIDYFVKDIANKNQKQIPQISAQVYQFLLQYTFPGNIRELRALVTDAVIANKAGELTVEQFKQKLVTAGLKEEGLMKQEEVSTAERIGSAEQAIIFPKTLPTLKQLKNMLYDEALRRVNYNKKAAAQLLCITRQAIEKRQESLKSKDE